MSAYATAAEFKQIAHQPVASADDAKFEALLDRASRMFDHLVAVPDNYFAAGSGSSARVFYGSGLTALPVPAYSSLTSITMPSGYTVPSYVYRNGYLYITTSTGVLDPLSVWPYGVPVTITATWGYTAIPDDVKQVVIEMAVKMWRGTDEAFSKTAALEKFVIELSPLAQSVLRSYQIANAMAVT